MKLKGFFLFETLLQLILYLFLLFGFFQVLVYQTGYTQKQETQIAEWQNLMGFESLLSHWLSSFSLLACLYPLELYQQSLLLHHQVILQKTHQHLTLYIGDLQLITKHQVLPMQAWIINQEHLKMASEQDKPPFWLFQYEKHVLKFVADKIYLEHEGHPQLLAEGLKGVDIKVMTDAIELYVQKPKFYKRYYLCQNTRKDLD